MQVVHFGALVFMFTEINPLLFVMQDKPTLLIFGAGVIGSVYAVELSKAGYDVLHYRLTPALIQSATFGEIDGRLTERINRLTALLSYIAEKVFSLA